MAATSDVFPQNGGQGYVKLHPFLITILRWCATYVWETTTLLLHRLMTTRIPQITAGKSVKPKSRVAGTDHLDPEPRVECVVLHQPEDHNIDVIFVHGLYGSLGNTWRQGDWKSTYKTEPELTTLIDHDKTDTKNNDNEQNDNGQNHDGHNDNEQNHNGQNDNVTVHNINENLKRIIPNENSLITEQFYDEESNSKSYDTQAKFVQDLFKNNCENTKRSTDNECECNGSGHNESVHNGSGRNDNEDCECFNNEKRCEVGCGCICDNCYSECWPRDWIKEDFPGARVISINYTSDPYLWRPLWVKEIKRLRLNERAEQMTDKLLELGVGRRPIVWVGHSKGGLFIKQIYCEAYEAHLKLINAKNNINNKNEFNNHNEQSDNDVNDITKDDSNNDVNDDNNSITVEDVSHARLWSQSSGFMFYSVPHRGSPLADIKTPITARSIELLEISENSSSTLSLQSRWVSAARAGDVTVTSLVETRRTLMSVLWLRIVSLRSADAGIGSVRGCSVDHRQVCKPRSRRCPLYTTLTALIHTANNKT